MANYIPMTQTYNKYSITNNNDDDENDNTKKSIKLKDKKYKF